MSQLVVLDPAVRIEDLPPRAPNTWTRHAVRRGSILIHEALETAAIVPPGDGLRQFIEDLRAPVKLEELIAEDDIGSDALEWQLLDNLLRLGFAYRIDDARMPAGPVLEQLRGNWREGCRHARRRLHVAVADVGPDVVCERVRSMVPAPSVTLEVGPRDVDRLEQLARAYEREGARAHDIVVDWQALECGPAARNILRRLGARVRLHVDRDASTVDAKLLRELAGDHVPVAVRVAVDPRRLAPEGWQALVRVLREEHVTSFELAIEWAEFARTDRTAEEAAVTVYDRVSAIGEELGDVRICGFPADDEIVQEALPERVSPASEIERAARRIHLDRRAKYLADIEGRYVWAQDPGAEELWVPSRDDLLPNHPELLGLADGSIVADIAGGFGRVARRLAPHVAPTGMIISIEKEPLFSSRTRRFAVEVGVPAIQARIGLCQRLPLADDSVDAGVLEWAGEIHRDGLLGRCIAEMRRVIRPGKRLGITYRLCNIPLDNLVEVFAPAPTIYPALREAVESAHLRIVAEKFWVVQTQLSDVPLAAYEERFLPRVLDDLRDQRSARRAPTIDLTLTVIAEKRRDE